MKNMTVVGKLQEGNFIMMDNEPCRIVGYSATSPDKRGGVKTKISAIGLFDLQKHSCASLPGDKIEVPTIKRGHANVLAIVANKAQLMDLATYETFELPIPMNLRGEVREGGEIEYLQALGRRKIELIRS